ncbi:MULTISPECIES: LON peptidase substrate-binding domain-containing protein [Maribacter]|uniref:LON peptidase substrate-binding domain-containing protein n=1 Tax=Maribacter flavus TaxID=1658664 RepID=A0ABU7II73_9FLAO|nr:MULTISPECIES: LON peptidase substrate-binding domain-containing protein [Maribacter]MDC6405123.1 LON peptidase substrate-binding domain-containing protein [Maribacter sp. PR66]MEE1972536.1 LON peptidase substrate-binding domain-containing protein [Maribacter flavus]
MKLPLFPLKSVFFPGETVPLHIFEPRYKQLIQDCREEAITFGIPVFHNNRLEYGTEVQLVEVVNTYEGGEMDVVCVARQVFKVVLFEPQMGEKLYPGGLVELLEHDYICPASYKAEVVKKIRELYAIMELPNTPIDLAKYNSFVLAHKIGLSYEQEYQLLKISKEQERLEFIYNHLVTTINVLSQVERTRKIIELNGHFKNFDPLDFKNIES